MKYKVGDKVRVREDLVKRGLYGGEIAVSDMVNMRRMTVTIGDVGEMGYGIEEDPYGYTWTDEMLEPVEEELTAEEAIRLGVVCNVNPSGKGMNGNVSEEKIANIMMPTRTGSWSSDVKYIPLSEYVGKRFEAFSKEKRYDKYGNTTTYSSERELSMAELLTRQYLEKELGAKVENMIATAKREVEESLVKSLEQKLKENLAKETIERMNIPDVLKRFSEMALEDKAE